MYQVKHLTLAVLWVVLLLNLPRDLIKLWGSISRMGLLMPAISLRHMENYPLLYRLKEVLYRNM